MYKQTIVFDPETQDFAMFLDDDLVGFARTYQDAETVLNELIYALLSAQHVRAVA